MGLGDFILIIDKLGFVGVLFVVVFLSVMFIGSLVDIFQFIWVMKRLKVRRSRAVKERLKAEILLEHYESIIRGPKPSPKASNQVLETK